MDKKTKFLIAIVAIIFFIGLVFGIFTIAKFCKLQIIVSIIYLFGKKNPTAKSCRENVFKLALVFRRGGTREGLAKR